MVPVVDHGVVGEGAWEPAFLRYFLPAGVVFGLVGHVLMMKWVYLRLTSFLEILIGQKVEWQHPHSA